MSTTATMASVSMFMAMSVTSVMATSAMSPMSASPSLATMFAPLTTAFILANTGCGFGRIPLYIHGPGIRSENNHITSKTALTIDIAPTIVELGIGIVPDSMDGQSLVGYFNLDQSEDVNT